MSPTITIRSNNVVLTTEDRLSISNKLFPLQQFIKVGERAHYDIVMSRIGAYKTPYYYISIKASIGTDTAMSVHSGRYLDGCIVNVVHVLGKRLRKRSERQARPRSVSPLIRQAAYQSW